MSARMPSRGEVLERVLRSMLGVALLAGVAWALAHGATSGPDVGGMLR
jgi:hypothetical protein